MIKLWLRKYLQLYGENFCLSKPVGHIMESVSKFFMHVRNCDNFLSISLTHLWSALFADVPQKEARLIKVKHMLPSSKKCLIESILLSSQNICFG